VDPDANLKEQLELAARINELRDRHEGPPDLDDVNRLAELVEALNKWILNGGFLPKAWHDVQVAKVMT
jgi:hypothetical protein